MKRPTDPRFGVELRRLREARAMSLRELSAVAHLSKSLLSLYENGSRLPSPANAAHLDKVLDAGGRLASLTPDPILGNEATPNGTPTQLEQAERVAHVERVPRALDGRAVESLGGVLAAHRRLDDTVPVEVLWPIASVHHQMLVRVAGEARGPHVPALHLLVAESLQFVGWLSAQRGQYEMADRMYTQSADRAEELGAGGLASQSRRFRGSLAWEQGRLVQMVTHYEHAAQTPGAGILHRSDAGLRHAHALALIGDHAGALRALQTASDLTTATDGAAPDPFAYWLTSSWLRFPLGLAHLGLGRAQDAADNLRAGLAGLPEQQREPDPARSTACSVAPGWGWCAQWVSVSGVDHFRTVDPLQTLRATSTTRPSVRYTVRSTWVTMTEPVRPRAVLSGSVASREVTSSSTRPCATPRRWLASSREPPVDTGSASSGAASTT